MKRKRKNDVAIDVAVDEPRFNKGDYVWLKATVVGIEERSLTGTTVYELRIAGFELTTIKKQA